MIKTAREEAAKQWNNTACGELTGDKNDISYFLEVEKDRYSQQPWQHKYFKFSEFENKRVLEIGTGQGTDLMQFARAGAKCNGVDITDNHLLLTRKNFDLQGYNVNLYKTDATKLPFEDNSLDCVYSFGVIHHIPEANNVVDEIYRVLRPNGKVMIAFYYKWSAFHIFIKILCHGLRCGWLFSKGYAGTLATIEHGADGVNIKPYVKLYSKKEMRKLFHKFDLEDISIHQLHPHHFYPSFLGKILTPFIKKLEPYLGWYVALTGKKATR